MLEKANRLEKRGLIANESFVLQLFVGALSDEFSVTKHHLRHKQTLTREDGIREVTIEYKELLKKRTGKKGARSSEQAYVADGGRGARSYGRGRSGGRGGGRSGGRGSSRGRGRARSSGHENGGGGGGGGVEESKGGGRGGADGENSGGRKPYLGRCFTCGKRGHKSWDCTAKESEYLPQCEHCGGYGHTKDKCPTEEAVLAEAIGEPDSDSDQAYMAEVAQPGECGTVVDLGLVGVEEQGQETDVMKYVADTAATCSMFRSADGFVNYRECNGWLLPLAENEEGGEGEGSADASSQGGGGDDDASESDLDVTEVSGPRQVAVPVHEPAPAEADDGTQGDVGSVPPSPPSGGGDFGGGMEPDGPTSSSSSSCHSSDMELESSSSSRSTSDADDGGGSDTSEQEPSERAPSAPTTTEAAAAAAAASGRTRKQTRETANTEAAGATGPNSEEAFLAQIRDSDGGQAKVANYVADSLVEDSLEDKQAFRVEFAAAAQWYTDFAREALGEHEAPTHPLPNPELRSTSPIGQKPSDVEALPETYKDVLRSEYRVLWEEAMQKEMGGHWTTGTFEKISGLPEGRRAVSSKWVFSWKIDSNGLIVAFKARLVARGFSQIPGVDYHHSSSGCPSIASIKTTLAVATEKGYPAQHWDISMAYIHAKLKELVFLRFPDGCGDMSGKVVKVERALYGLKQSGREWGFEAADNLIANGYEQSRADPCVFRKVVDGKVGSIVVINVDDILFVGPEEERVELLTSLQKKLPVKDLGPCTWYDGCAIDMNLELGTTKLSQTAYIEAMLKKFGVTDIADTPAIPGADLGPRRDDEPLVKKPVRQVIGSLMWSAAFTRPEIAPALNAVQMHAHSACDRQWQALLRILAYLNATKHFGITYVRGSGLDLEVYVDASYADKETDRRSLTGIAVTVGGAIVSHASKTQRVVALSTSEAEYIAAGEGLKEALFVRAVLSFIAPEKSGAKIKVLEDNEGAKALVENPFSLARSKHIDVRFHFIRELFKSGRITIEFVPTEEQHADMLTKVLGRAKLEKHRRFLMNLPE
eukprot:g19668.t1